MFFVNISGLWKYACAEVLLGKIPHTESTLDHLGKNFGLIVLVFNSRFTWIFLSLNILVSTSSFWLKNWCRIKYFQVNGKLMNGMFFLREIWIKVTEKNSLRYEIIMKVIRTRFVVKTIKVYMRSYSCFLYFSCLVFYPIPF